MKFPRKQFLCALLAGLMLAMAGCGGSTDTETTADTAPAVTETESVETEPEYTPLPEKDMDGWKSVYIYDYKDATAEVVRKIAEEAGVHFYVEELSPIRATENLLMAHVKDGGKKKITLKKKYSKITELYTNKIVATNASEFEYDFASPDTALFFLEE